MASHSSTTKCVNIFDLPNKEDFLKSFDVIVTNLEGVFYKNNVPLPGSAEAAQLLITKGKSLKLLVDDGRQNDEQLPAFLKDLDLPEIPEEDILYPTKLLAKFMQKYEGKQFFSLCSSETNDYLAKNGVAVTEMKPNIELTLNTLKENVKPTHKITHVLMDTNFNLTYGQLAKAQQYVKEPHCSLVVSTVNQNIVLRENITTLGNAGFVQLLRDHAAKPVILLCKPSSELVDLVKTQLRITNPNRVLYVATQLIDDAAFGIKCDFKVAIITSSAPDMDVMNKLTGAQQPHYIINKFADFLKLMTVPASSSTIRRV